MGIYHFHMKQCESYYARWMSSVVVFLLCCARMDQHLNIREGNNRPIFPLCVMGYLSALGAVHNLKSNQAVSVSLRLFSISHNLAEPALPKESMKIHEYIKICIWEPIVSHNDVIHCTKLNNILFLKLVMY